MFGQGMAELEALCARCRPRCYYVEVQMIFQRPKRINTCTKGLERFKYLLRYQTIERYGSIAPDESVASSWYLYSFGVIYTFMMLEVGRILSRYCTG